MLYRWIQEDGDYEELLSEYLMDLPDHRRHWAAVVARQERDYICKNGGLAYFQSLRGDPNHLHKELAMALFR